MEINALYTTAKSMIDVVKAERPEAVKGEESSLCLIATDDDQLFTGITGIKINNKKRRNAEMRSETCSTWHKE